MHSTSTYGNARFKKVESERILHELGYRKIVIVTGFQGVNKYEDYATMGRGGSDTTAVAIAAALGADACEIYTDVDGVYTADPRIVPSARKLKEISYDEMQELASMGANVLHNRSVEMAKKYGVQLVVRSSMNREEGTVVKEVVKVEKLLISGVASDKKYSENFCHRNRRQTGNSVQDLQYTCKEEYQCGHHSSVCRKRRYKRYFLYSGRG